MDDRIKKIANHYGYETQSRQLIEEMAELTQAVNKLWRFEKECIGGTIEIHKAKVTEEIADVEIVLGQIKYLLGVKKETEIWREKKLERTLEKIEPEKMVTVIEGTHDISIDPAAKKYVWRVPDGLTVKIGDIVRVNTGRGQDNALVLEVCEMPLSEAEKHKAVVGVLNLGA